MQKRSRQSIEARVGLVNPGLAFLGLDCAPARVDLQQPAVLVVVVHALGHEAVVLAKDLRCDQGEGGPVHGIAVSRLLVASTVAGPGTWRR